LTASLLLLSPAVKAGPAVAVAISLFDGGAYAVKEGAVVVVAVAEGGKPVCDDGRVDVGGNVAEMFAISPIFVFDLY
jgi:hypothetical protein